MDVFCAMGGAVEQQAAMVEGRGREAMDLGGPEEVPLAGAAPPMCEVAEVACALPPPTIASRALRRGRSRGRAPPPAPAPCPTLPPPPPQATRRRLSPSLPVDVTDSAADLA